MEIKIQQKMMSINSMHFSECKSNKKEVINMFIVKDEQSPQCPTGIHDAVLQSIEKRQHDSYGEYLLLAFAVDASNGEDAEQFEVTCACSVSLSANSKLRRVINSLLGRELSQEEAKAGFDVEKLISSSCRVLVNSVEGKEGNTYSRVESVLPS